MLSLISFTLIPICKAMNINIIPTDTINRTSVAIDNIIIAKFSTYTPYNITNIVNFLNESIGSFKITLFEIKKIMIKPLTTDSYNNIYKNLYFPFENKIPLYYNLYNMTHDKNM
jgi:transcriptional regulator of heat shock response